jgi:hypothetical protein
MDVSGEIDRANARDGTPNGIGVNVCAGGLEFSNPFQREPS